jgi:carboxylate-amine ligase
MEAVPGPTTMISEELAEEAESQDLLTLGVEEEYLLVDAVEPRGVEAVEDVFDQVPDDLKDSVQHEYTRSQIEVASPPQLELRDLWASMTRLRTGLAEAADRAGVRLVAVGAGPAAGPHTRIVDRPRFHRMRERFGDLSPGQGLNGMHVHVSVPDPETGVQILNHLRPWLPILQAATVNSPLFAGHDTGYASWRSMLWERWPTVGPAPYLESHQHYETLVSDLIASGAMLDEGMLYWYARLSARYPTIEIRIGDVCPTLDDTLLLASLTRALVATILDEVRDGMPAPNVAQPLLAAAHWRAAHD